MMMMVRDSNQKSPRSNNSSMCFPAKSQYAQMKGPKMGRRANGNAFVSSQIPPIHLEMLFMV